MVFYLLAILTIFVAPLAVPVTTTVYYAIRDSRKRAADAHAAHPARVGAVRPAFRPARTAAVPSEA